MALFSLRRCVTPLSTGWARFIGSTGRGMFTAFIRWCILATIDAQLLTLTHVLCCKRVKLQINKWTVYNIYTHSLKEQPRWMARLPMLPITARRLYAVFSSTQRYIKTNYILFIYKCTQQLLFSFLLLLPSSSCWRGCTDWCAFQDWTRGWTTSVHGPASHYSYGTSKQHGFKSNDSEEGGEEFSMFSFYLSCDTGIPLCGSLAIALLRVLPQCRSNPQHDGHACTGLSGASGQRLAA